MGMGKTIEIISTILTNKNLEPPSAENNFQSSTTLIVCPVSVLQQWHSEIVNNTIPPLNVYIYHGPNRNKDPQFLIKYDIVLTTYTTLVSEFNDEASNISINNNGNDSDGGNNNQLPENGIHSVRWFRIVLDEAHTIKERTTRTSRSSYSLHSKIRWCVTGTPIQNKLDDLFSLIHFLRVEPFSNYSWWNQYILKPSKLKDDIGFSRLRVCNKVIIL
ncbi:hypothetical protein DICPUDRAFT_31970 [Dictyostelium purpureum]|uniref:Helicase ATP-binding domain-containing protein n=1 Tax=Dictyostelium purpureum TaxID=5786 RepID=F0ZI73_DICPU|nr:uncharacterized protein DICPUDRAFT_31970 [Dictyostelium purpureum]EGC36371.1 hypothetical protein DICPUDRAFT_31970 [Dictyostelium purpureum]|eukprot:XP_003287125.1 hypothetical protein DICPUDRAFT_31970 [Dictyostelium purpureum]